MSEKALLILDQTIGTYSIIFGLSAIIIYCKIYPIQKLNELVSILYKFIIPVSFVYSLGWKAAEWTDYKVIISLTISQCIVLALSAGFTYLILQFQVQKPFRTLSKFLDTFLQLGLLCCSSMAQTTSIPQINNKQNQLKYVQFYECSCYLMVPFLLLIKSQLSKANFTQSQKVKAAQRDAIISVELDQQEQLEGDKKDIEQQQPTFKEQQLLEPLFVSTLLGLILLGIDLPNNAKQKDLPYFINQTFIYLQKLVIITQNFCLGISLFGQIKKITSMELFALLIKALFVELVKQILFPYLVLLLNKLLKVQSEIDYSVFAAPSGILWLYFGYEGLAVINALGLIAMWVLQWAVW